MNFSPSALFAGFVFGVLGLFFLKRGKRDGDIVDICLALVLMIYPYFLENVYLLWAVGGVLTFFGFRRKGI